MTDDERWQGIAIYALYLVALFTGVPFLIGVILAYVFRNGGSLEVQTHYEHQIGLFWRFVLGNILNGILCGIGALLTWTFVFAVIGIPLLIIAAVGFVWLWLMMLARCIRGISRLNAYQAYPVPAGWGL